MPVPVADQEFLALRVVLADLLLFQRLPQKALAFHSHLQDHVEPLVFGHS